MHRENNYAIISLQPLSVLPLLSRTSSPFLWELCDLVSDVYNALYQTLGNELDTRQRSHGINRSIDRSIHPSNQQAGRQQLHPGPRAFRYLGRSLLRCRSGFERVLK